jgi:hypothetical protein
LLLQFNNKSTKAKVILNRKKIIYINIDWNQKPLFFLCHCTTIFSYYSCCPLIYQTLNKIIVFLSYNIWNQLFYTFYSVKLILIITKKLRASFRKLQYFSLVFTKTCYYRNHIPLNYIITINSSLINWKVSSIQFLNFIFQIIWL